MKIRRLGPQDETQSGDLVYGGVTGDDGLREFTGSLGVTVALIAYPVFRVEGLEELCHGEAFEWREEAERLRSERDKAYKLLGKLLITLPDSVTDEALHRLKNLRP